MLTRNLMARSFMVGGLAILLSAAVCRAEDTLQAKTYGWRGNWTGLYPDSNPPTQWGRTASGVMAGMTCQARRPAEACAKSGQPVDRGLIRDWLLIGPLKVEDSAKDLAKEQIPDEAKLCAAGRRQGRRPGLAARRDREEARLRGLGHHRDRGARSRPGSRLQAQRHGLCRHVRLRGARGHGGHGRRTRPRTEGLAQRPGRLPERGPRQRAGQLRRHQPPEAGVGPRQDAQVRAGPEEGLEPAARQGLQRTRRIPGPTCDSTRGCTTPTRPPTGRRTSPGWRSCPSGPTPARWSSATAIFTPAEPDELLCLDKATGKILWRRLNTLLRCHARVRAGRAPRPQGEDRAAPGGAPADRPTTRRASSSGGRSTNCWSPPTRRSTSSSGTGTSPRTSASSASPRPPSATASSVYAFFGYGVVACYDLDGNRRWIRRLEANEVGYTCSPALSGGKLLCVFGGLHALDAATGQESWANPEAGCTASIIPIARRLDRRLHPPGRRGLPQFRRQGPVDQSGQGSGCVGRPALPR